MENELKDNEYIRTDTGKIDKVINANYYMPQYIECEKDLIFKNNIVKHSPKLLDLIKAEDVIKIKTGLYSSFMHFVVDEDDLIYIKAQMEAGFWIIDKIYTKEMMESISYKVTKM